MEKLIKKLSHKRTPSVDLKLLVRTVHDNYAARYGIENSGDDIPTQRNTTKHCRHLSSLIDRDDEDKWDKGSHSKQLKQSEDDEENEGFEYDYTKHKKTQSLFTGFLEKLNQKADPPKPSNHSTLREMLRL